MKTQLIAYIAGTLAYGILASADAQPALKDVFTNDFRVGAALNPWHFSGATNAEVQIIEKHVNTITPENALKWGAVHPRPDWFAFAQADCLVEFGQKHEMFIISQLGRKTEATHPSRPATHSRRVPPADALHVARSGGDRHTAPGGVAPKARARRGPEQPG